jgi:hypothetical protein
MKTPRLSLFAILSSIIFSLSCQKNGRDYNPAPEKTSDGIKTAGTNRGIDLQVPAGACNPNAYIITLESKTEVDGNWEWIWSVQNPNPGNGGNGTAQNLSHWGMQFGGCLALTSVVSAGYSADGVNWTYFTPSYQPDPSQQCVTTSVFKFDFGTTGNAKSYYKIVVSEDYPVDGVNGYYKSGVKTGCCTFIFQGIGCNVVK